MRAVLEHGLAGLLGIHEGRGIDVDHHLVALRRGAGVDAVVKGRLGDQRERVRLLLGHRRRVGLRLIPTSLLIQGLARRGQRLYEQRADLWRQAAPEGHHAILILIHVKRAARVLPGGLASLGLPVHSSPAPHDPFDVLGRARASHRQQLLLGPRGGDAGQGSDLGV